MISQEEAEDGGSTENVKLENIEEEEQQTGIMAAKASQYFKNRTWSEVTHAQEMRC